MHRASHIRRLVGAAVAIPGLLVPTFAVVGSATPAWASSAVSCTKLKGTASNDTATVSGCSAAQTGGSGMLSSFVPSGGTVTWANGTTTTYATAVQPPQSKFPCPSGTNQFNLKGSVSSSTNTSIPTGDTVKMIVCYNPSTMTLKNAPGSKVKF